MTVSYLETFGSPRRYCFAPTAPVASLRRPSNRARRASAPAAPSSPLRAEAGRYRLMRRLGAGATAEVFEAQLEGIEGFKKTVAVKRMLPGREASQSRTFMFFEEARLAARFSHPNVVSALDFDRDGDGRSFIVMEHVSGVDVAALVESGPVPCSVAIFIASEMLAGLGYLHDLPGDGTIPGLVHRDLSPHNVLLSWQGVVQIADFGIAKARARGGLAVPASATLRGTVGYMSPEQVNGESLDGRSDLFSAGVLLWELLVGRKLFVGNPREIMARVLRGEVEPPSTYRTGIPEDLERVVMRLLARDRGYRYAAAGLAQDELVLCRDAPTNGRDELERLLRERFPGTAPQRRSRRSAEETKPRRSSHGTITDPSVPQAPWRWDAGDVVARLLAARRRQRRLRALVAIIALLGALALLLGR